jgi:hypothetical protein
MQNSVPTFLPSIIFISKKQGQNKSSPEFYFVFRFSPTIVEDMLFYAGLTILNPQLHYTFISTSTPLGSSSFIKASMVFEEEL